MPITITINLDGYTNRNDLLAVGRMLDEMANGLNHGLDAGLRAMPQTTVGDAVQAANQEAKAEGPWMPVPSQDQSQPDIAAAFRQHQAAAAWQPGDGLRQAEPVDDEGVSTNPPAVDAAGLPWDSRIHSSNRQTVADGTWRKRRGVDPAVVEVVEGQLRGTPVGVVTPSAPPPPPPPVVTAAPPPPPPPPAEPAVIAMQQALPIITGALAAQTLTQANLVAACEALGVTGGLAGYAAKADADWTLLLINLGLRP